MKAEFEKHQCTVLLYPERKDVWRKNAAPIKKTVEQLAETISQYETVILGHNCKVAPKVKKSASLSMVNLIHDDIWARDNGPIALYDGSFAAFAYDVKGRNLVDYKKDQSLATVICQLLGAKLNLSKLIYEGGNLISDGNGTLLSVKERALQPNGSLSLKQIEKELKQILKIKQIIWLPRGLTFDETGGHIDNLCSFADAKTIFMCWTDDKKNPQYEVVHEAYEILSFSCNTDGKPYDIVKVPIPDIFKRTEEDCKNLKTVKGSKPRLPGEPIQASYVNFIFANGAVIVPQFSEKQDEKVLQIFKKFFKEREVIPFNTREVVLGGGGLHCISKNI